MRFSLDIPRWLVLAQFVLAVVVAARTSAQTGLPGLELRRADDGRLMLVITGETNRAVLEQANSLTPPINWGPAQTASDGAIDNRAPLRVFRLRLLPVPAAPASSAGLGVLSFQESPPRLRSGETVQFVVTGDAGAAVDAKWFVDNLAGGSTNVGVITEVGRFTAPPTLTNRTVEVRAEVIAANGDRARAQTLIEIFPPIPPRGGALIPVAPGGELHSVEPGASIQVPPGAMTRDTFIEIVPAGPDELAALNADASQTKDVIARVELLPDGTTFDPPATVRVKLDRYFEPGTRLPLEIKRVTPAGEVWEPAGIEGEVELDGVTLVFKTPHFSVLRVIAPRPLIPNAPNVTAVIPARLTEGELRPFLLTGTGFARSLRVTAHEPGNLLSPTPLLQVRQTAFDPAAPGEFGVLLKSLPDANLRAGATKNYLLRLAYVGSGAATTVNITVDGLGEFILGAGQTMHITMPATNKQVFSRIAIGEGAFLQIGAGYDFETPVGTLPDQELHVLAWQATDRVEILGRVRSLGQFGEDGHDNGGGALFGPGGSGANLSYHANGTSFDITDARAGSPVLTPDLTQYLPGALAKIYGQPGANGHDPGLGHYQDPLPPESYDMYGLYEDELRARLPGRDPFDFNFWHRLSEDLTGLYPLGRNGHQGVPGGFRVGSGRSGFHIGDRPIEPGGNGGGGGLSFRFNGFNLGLGGGQGGGGGGAISLVAGGELILGSSAWIETTGGSAGSGASHSYSVNQNTFQDRGGGGGTGGAGTIHLLAGERLTRLGGPAGLPFGHSAGSYYGGGFEMNVNTHRQADPRSWLEPVREPPALSEAELAGPDFSTQLRGLRTGIQTGRAVEAVALNPFGQGSTVRVINSRGARTFRLSGVNANTRRVRLLLAPGTNHVEISGLADHAVLNREVLVLNTPDTDGDGLSDAEEPGLGYNPAAADTDGDGLSDSEEWLAGGNGAPGDSDGDGYPDAVEFAFGSDANDPGSTPLNTNLGSGSNRAILMVSPPGVQVIRPAIGLAHGVPFSLTVAQPQSVRVEHR